MLNKSNFHIVFFVASISLLFLSACTNRPKGILSQNEMAEVLTELHKLDGTLSVEDLGYKPESAYYYENLLEKYHVTQAEFDSSLVWYSRNPKRFEKVYIKVVANVESWEKEITGGKYHPIEAIDTIVLPSIASSQLWDKPAQYILTKDSARKEIDFEIKNDSLLFGDVYILSYHQRIAPEDSAKERKAQLFVNYLNGKSDTLSTMLYNDSILRRITFYMHAKDSLKIKSLSGKLLTGSGYKGKQNVFIDSISFIRRYNPLVQDSLRTVVEAKDTTSVAVEVKSIKKSSKEKKSIERKLLPVAPKKELERERIPGSPR